MLSLTSNEVGRMKGSCVDKELLKCYVLASEADTLGAVFLQYL